jgi:hypothetical protein
MMIAYIPSLNLQLVVAIVNILLRLIMHLNSEVLLKIPKNPDLQKNLLLADSLMIPTHIILEKFRDMNLLAILFSHDGSRLNRSGDKSPGCRLQVSPNLQDRFDHAINPVTLGHAHNEENRTDHDHHEPDHEPCEGRNRRGPGSSSPNCNVSFFRQEPL